MYVCMCVCGIRVIMRLLCVYNRGDIVKNCICHVKEFRLHSIVSGKVIQNSKGRDVFHVCNKKDVIGNMKDRLEGQKQRRARPVKGHCSCSHYVDFS